VNCGARQRERRKRALAAGVIFSVAYWKMRRGDDLLAVHHERLDEGEQPGGAGLRVKNLDCRDGHGAALILPLRLAPRQECFERDHALLQERPQNQAAEHVGVRPVADADLEPAGDVVKRLGRVELLDARGEHDGEGSLFVLAGADQALAQLVVRLPTGVALVGLVAVGFS
jgi:hypothetical protein